VAAFAHGRRHAVVDTNVRRVVARWRQGRADAASMPLSTVEDLLPAEPARAVQVSAALMELGALICRTRTPRCDDCPISTNCRWRQAGRPPNSTPRRGQGYAGTDRQARGRLLAALREDAHPLRRESLLAVCPDPEQALRALAGLRDDGLVQELPDGTVRLPG
jgi:A/G-specific adenine glycosylase